MTTETLATSQLKENLRAIRALVEGLVVFEPDNLGGRYVDDYVNITQDEAGLTSVVITDEQSDPSGTNTGVTGRRLTFNERLSVKAATVIASGEGPQPIQREVTREGLSRFVASILGDLESELFLSRELV